MAPFRLLAPRPPWALLTATLVATLPCGCKQEDSIQAYEVPRVEVRAAPPAPSTEARLLGAVIPQGDKSWFVKFQGPSAAVGEQKTAFDQFIASIRLPKDGPEPITWTLPTGWTKSPEQKPERYATLKVSPAADAPEVTITQFGGTLLANINRWRGQLGLDAVTEAELVKTTTEVKLDGATAHVVDLTGKSSGGGMGAPFAKNHPPMPKAAPTPAPSGSPGFQFRVPERWERTANAQLSVLTFRIAGADNKSALFTVTPLVGQAGGLLPNVNRWRGQVGLGPVNDGQMRQQMQKLTVAGSTAPYFDLSGDGAATARMLVAVIERDGQSWFFKLVGPGELVGQHKSNFESFLASVRFDGITGG